MPIHRPLCLALRLALGGSLLLSGVAAAKREVVAKATGAPLEALVRGTPGHARLIHVWASWCRPCVAEMPEVTAELRKMAAPPVDLVLLSVDGRTGADRAKRVLEAAGATGTSWVADPPEVVGLIRSAVDPAWDGALPSTFFVGDQGQLVLAQRGITELDPLRRAVDEVIHRHSNLRRTSQ